MEAHPYVAQVQSQLAAAAALGDDAARAIAEALAAAAEPAIRLALLAAVTAAADDITVALLDAPGAPAIAVRLDGDDIRIEVVTTESVEPPVDVPDDNTTARVSLRLPEAVKDQVDVAARRDGVSVNTWLLRAATLALTGGTTRSSRSTSGQGHPQRLTGWINT